MAILIKHASKHAVYNAIHSSCYNLETKRFLKCAKIVYSITKVTEVL